MTVDPKPILAGGSHTVPRAVNLGDSLMRWPLSGAKRRRKYIYDHDAIGKRQKPTSATILSVSPEDAARDLPNILSGQGYQSTEGRGVEAHSAINCAPT